MLGELDPVAFDAGKPDFQRVSFWADGADVDSFSRRLWRRDDRTRGEVEGDAEDIGILDIEQAFFVELIRLAAQCTADDLLAEQLSAECPDAQHVGHRISIPTLGE